MAGGIEDLPVAAALESERHLVLTLGGFVLEIAGAKLVTHEKLPAPRFNFVQVSGVGPDRRTAFFERALDHYFQRALRPTFRVEPPVEAHLDEGLRSFGFRPRPAPLALLLDHEPPSAREPSTREVRVAAPAERDVVASFWTSERERPEFLAALDVAWSHPHPGERLQPVLAFQDGEAVSAALVYRYRSSAGIYAVATRPSARGRGAASDLVRFVRTSDPTGPGVRYSIFADSPRLESRLERLGFRVARSFLEYELPANAELAFPPPGPPSPPRWRPPR